MPEDLTVAMEKASISIVCTNSTDEDVYFEMRWAGGLVAKSGLVKPQCSATLVRTGIAAYFDMYALDSNGNRITDMLTVPLGMHLLLIKHNGRIYFVK